MNDKKETILMFIFVGAFLISVFFMCAGRTSVHNLRERADSVRTELDNARKEQQKQSETLKKAERATGTSRERIADSKRVNQEITDTERADAEIVDECQSILARVRERGGKEN